MNSNISSTVAADRGIVDQLGQNSPSKLNAIHDTFGDLSVVPAAHQPSGSSSSAHLQHGVIVTTSPKVNHKEAGSSGEGSYHNNSPNGESSDTSLEHCTSLAVSQGPALGHVHIADGSDSYGSEVTVLNVVAIPQPTSQNSSLGSCSGRTGTDPSSTTGVTVLIAAAATSTISSSENATSSPETNAHNAHAGHSSSFEDDTLLIGGPSTGAGSSSSPAATAEADDILGARNDPMLPLRSPLPTSSTSSHPTPMSAIPITTISPQTTSTTSSRLSFAHASNQDPDDCGIELEMDETGYVDEDDEKQGKHSADSLSSGEETSSSPLLSTSTAVPNTTSFFDEIEDGGAVFYDQPKPHHQDPTVASCFAPNQQRGSSTRAQPIASSPTAPPRHGAMGAERTCCTFSTTDDFSKDAEAVAVAEVVSGKRSDSFSDSDELSSSDDADNVFLTRQVSDVFKDTNGGEEDRITDLLLRFDDKAACRYTSDSLAPYCCGGNSNAQAESAYDPFFGAQGSKDIRRSNQNNNNNTSNNHCSSGHGSTIVPPRRHARSASNNRVPSYHQQYFNNHHHHATHTNHNQHNSSTSSSNKSNKKASKGGKRNRNFALIAASTAAAASGGEADDILDGEDSQPPPAASSGGCVEDMALDLDDDDDYGDASDEAEEEGDDDDEFENCFNDDDDDLGNEEDNEEGAFESDDLDVYGNAETAACEEEDDDAAYSRRRSDASHLNLDEQRSIIFFYKKQRAGEYNESMITQQQLRYDLQAASIKILLNEAHRHQILQLQAAKATQSRICEANGSWKEVGFNAEDDFEDPSFVQRRLSCMCMFTPTLANRSYQDNDGERGARIRRQHDLLMRLQTQRAMGGNPFFFESMSIEGQHTVQLTAEYEKYPDDEEAMSDSDDHHTQQQHQEPTQETELAKPSYIPRRVEQIGAHASSPNPGDLAEDDEDIDESKDCYHEATHDDYDWINKDPTFNGRGSGNRFDDFQFVAETDEGDESGDFASEHDEGTDGDAETHGCSGRGAQRVIDDELDESDALLLSVL